MNSELCKRSARPASRPVSPLPAAVAGVTLTELLMVIVVVAILVSIAVPSFKYITTANRVAGEVNGLLGDMQYARAEAIREGQTVTVCNSSNGTTCSNNTSWQNGWIVFSDPNGNQAVDPGEPILRVQPTFTSTDTFVAGNAVSAVTFNREGFAGLPGATLFTLHDSTSNTAWTRCLSISVIGQLTTEGSGVGGCL